MVICIWVIHLNMLLSWRISLCTPPPPIFLSGKERWQCGKSYKKYWRRIQDFTTWLHLKPSTLLTGVAAMATPHLTPKAWGAMGTRLRMCWPRSTVSQVSTAGGGGCARHHRRLRGVSLEHMLISQPPGRSGHISSSRSQSSFLHPR